VTFEDEQAVQFFNWWITKWYWAQTEGGHLGCRPNVACIDPNFKNYFPHSMAGSQMKKATTCLYNSVMTFYNWFNNETQA
jgi:hypothetical protein